MSLEHRIHVINQEWADAGDDVPDELKYIRLLKQRIESAMRELDELIDGGEECHGRDSRISRVIRILDGEGF